MPKTIPITYELKQEIRKVHALDPSLSNRALAKRFGIHHKTVGNILSLVDVRFTPLPGGKLKIEEIPLPTGERVPVDNETEADLIHYKTKAKTLEASLKGLLKERGKYKALVEDLKTSILATEPYPRVPILGKPASSSPIAAVLKLSDWQIGEVINASETEGFGEFNFAIAERRVFELIEGFLGWVEMHRKAGYNIQQLHVFSEADLVSGNIHYELEVTNEFPVTMAAVKAGMLLSETVSQLSAHFETVDVWEVSADNHGRLTRKNQSKQGAVNNYSYVAHVICNESLVKHRNVIPYLGEGVKLLANVVGKKFLLSHGHQVLSSLGIPYYGLERDRAREAVKRQNTDKTFDYVSIGHFHVPAIIGQNILVNGSLTGTTEFDHGCGRHAPPSQVSFMVHPKHGLFDWVAWKLQ